MRMEHQAKLSGASTGMCSGLLLATSFDVATDGFIIGAGFAAGGQTGTILALGLSVELWFLGLALASGATSGRRIVALSGALGITVLLFSVLGSALLTGASSRSLEHRSYHAIKELNFPVISSAVVADR
jgi:ZIP family zinc transporter